MSKVSVIMPAYNSEKYIAEAIDSILNQTYTDFEFIIINDGSNDRTERIIKSYKDTRIKYFANEKNKGIVYTLNKGLQLAKGDYIVRMDSDDISKETRIQKQIDFMENHPKVGVLGTGIKIFGEGIKEEVRLFNTSPDMLKAELLFHCCVAHPTVMIRKSVLKDGKLIYNEEFLGKEDFALWWEISKRSDISTISEDLVYYRSHGNQITKKNNGETRKVSEKLLMYRLKDLEMDFGSEEMQCLLSYCRNETEKFSLKTSFVFIEALSKIIQNNNQTNYFDNDSLRKVCGLAVTYVIFNSQIEKRNRKMIYYYAMKKRIYPFMMGIKSFYYILRE